MAVEFDPILGALRMKDSSSGGGVTGPVASTDNAIVRFDGTTGQIIQDYISSPPTITDNGQMSVGPSGQPVATIGATLNTYCTDLNSFALSNSFQTSGSLNTGGSFQSLQFNATESGTNNVNTIQGINGLAIKSVSGTIASLIAINASPRINGTVSATSMIAFNAQPRTSAAGASATTIVSFNAAAASMTGTATNSYGVKIAAQKITGVTTGYGIGADGANDINYFMGQVGVGTNAPNANAALDVTSTTKAFMPPRMTTTQKNAIASPTAGMVVYDNVLNKLCVYTTAWETITSV